MSDQNEMLDTEAPELADQPKYELSETRFEHGRMYLSFLPGEIYSRFPKIFLPEELRDIVIKSARVYGAWPSYIFSVLIAGLLGMVGGRSLIEVKRGRLEPLGVAMILIGPTDAGAARVLRAFVGRVAEIDEREASAAARGPESKDPVEKLRMARQLKAYRQLADDLDPEGLTAPPMREELRRYLLNEKQPPQLLFSRGNGDALEKAAISSSNGVIFCDGDFGSMVSGSGGEARRRALIRGLGGGLLRTASEREGSSGGPPMPTITAIGTLVTNGFPTLKLERCDGLVTHSLAAVEHGPVTTDTAEKDDADAARRILDLLLDARSFELPKTLILSSVVRSLFSEAHARVLLEAEAVDGGQEVFSLAELAMCRIACAIELALCIVRGRPWAGVSREAAMIAAAVYQEYYAPGLMDLLIREQEDPIQGVARELAPNLIRRGPGPVSIREISRNRRGWNARGYAVREVVAVLAEEGVVSLTRSTSGANGGAPSNLVEVNPDFRAAYEEVMEGRRTMRHKPAPDRRRPGKRRSPSRGK